MRAARFAALLAVAALAAAAGTARAQCAGDPAVFKHTPSVDGSRDARAALLGALAGCGAAETLEETFEAVTSGNPASLFGGAVPASYSGTCSSLPTSILASASADLLGARALACSEVGAAVTLDFGDEGVEGFGLYAFDAQQPVTVRLLGAGGAVAAEFDVFTAAELAAGQFAHAFWGVQTRGLGVRSVQIEQTGVTSNAWFLDGLVAVRPPAVCSTVCENGGADDDCDGVCTGCDNNFGGALCDECSTACENGGVDEDCDGVCDGCDGMFGGDLCDECMTSCANGGADDDCDGVCTGCDNLFGGALCDECSTACERDTDCDGVCDLMCTGGKAPSADGSECVCPDGQQDVDGVCLLVPAGCTAARGGSASERHTHVSTGLCAGIVWNECTA